MMTRKRITTGNMASPELDTTAAAVWTTEDFLAAEPYPIPEITEATLKDYLETLASPSDKGGSTLPGGPPSSTDATGNPDADKLTGYPYPPPFNQHEVL